MISMQIQENQKAIATSVRRSCNSGISNCLVITQRFPFPPDRGDRIRSYQMLKFLSRRSTVWLACTADEMPTPDQLQHVRQFCDGGVAVHQVGPVSRSVGAATRLVCGRSATQGAFHSRAMHRTLDEWSQFQSFDAAVAYCSSMGPYLNSLRRRPRRVLLDLVDLDSQKWWDYAAASRGWRRWLYRLEAHRVHQLEQRLAQHSDHITLVSQQEVDLFSRQHPGYPAVALTNGVDTEYFSPTAIPAAKVEGLKQGTPQFVFAGVLNYQPNTSGIRWFCQEVWPLIRQRWPAAHIDIVGRTPTNEVLALEAISGVRVVGSVPDVRPYTLAADIAIAPLRIARGIQNKVLEGLAMARPVIATPQAATGIDPNPGLLVASSPQQWLEAVETLFASSEGKRDRGLAGREHVELHYSWDARLQPLEHLLSLGE